MVIHQAAKRLTNSETPVLDARVLLSYAVNNGGRPVFRDLTPDEINKFEKLLQRRIAGEPVAYIIGEKEFMGLSFKLNRDCLIPRPDTETVVEYLMERLKGASPAILDLCCGSGCIGLSLAHYIKGAHVTLVDISPGALDATNENVRLHGLTERCKVIKKDVLNDSYGCGWDVIVSNPPYIPTDTVKSLDVAKTEPIFALDGGTDGLDFYRAITPKAYAALNDGGCLAFEIGYDQGETVSGLLKDSGFKNVIIKKDYGGNPRLCFGEKL